MGTLVLTAVWGGLGNYMVLTEGGPNNKTMVASLYNYRYFFPISATESTVPQYGYGVALSVVTAFVAGWMIFIEG